MISIQSYSQSILTQLNFNKREDVKRKHLISKLEIITTFEDSKEELKDILSINDQFFAIDGEYIKNGKKKGGFSAKLKNDSLQIEKLRFSVQQDYGSNYTEHFYYYDQNNFLIKHEVKGLNSDEILFKTTFENNENGDPIKLIINDGEYGMETAIYDYEKRTVKISNYGRDIRLITSIIHSLDGPKKGDYKLDTKGNVTENDKYVFQYTYDSKNNWIKRIDYKKNGKNKIKQSQTVRKITYE